MPEDRLMMLVRHAWRVRRLRPAIIAIADRLARGRVKEFWLRQLPWYLGKYWVERVCGGVIALDDCRLDTNGQVFTTFERGSLWLQRYEDPERVAIARFLEPDLPVVDLGASVGALSCLVNRRLQRPTAHVAVEPNAALISSLERNRELNRASFAIVHAALAYAGAAGFAPGADNLEGRVIHDAGSGPVVRTVTLGQLLDQFGFDRVTLICDIEGTETELLAHEAETLADRVSTFIIEFHPWIYGVERVRELVQQLRQAGFDEIWTQYGTYVFKNTRWSLPTAPPRRTENQG